MWIQKYSQFAGDDVDHNIRTLDGSGTFLGMEIVAYQLPFQEILF